MGNDWDWRTSSTHQPKPKKQGSLIAKLLKKRKDKKPPKG